MFIQIWNKDNYGDSAEILSVLRFMLFDNIPIASINYKVWRQQLPIAAQNVLGDSVDGVKLLKVKWWMVSSDR